MPRPASYSRSAETRPGTPALQPLWGRRAVHCPRLAGARARGGGSHADLAQRRRLGRAALAARRSLSCRQPVARLVVRARRAQGLAARELRHRAVARAHPGCDVYRAGDGVHRRWLALRQCTASVLERIGIALNPYHRYVCSAEQQMFEHPRLRAVICNSKMVRDEVRRTFRIGREKLHVIYNGVDVEHFHPRKRETLRGVTRAELGCRPRDTLFLFVGSGFSRKGLAAAIDALAAAANSAFWLLVVGRDREEARFARQARAAGLAERVRFLGGRDDVRPLYAAADCFILPSRYDPFPNTALEALAMGLPAIVSSRCGAAEIIEPGTNGWVCEPDDAPGIARLMQAADGAIRDERMARAARSTAERFGIEAMAGKLAELYAALNERR